MLLKKELKQLRSEVIINSVMLDDYKNSLLIKPETAAAFFDGFIAYIATDLKPGMDIWDALDSATFADLWNYYNSFESDPLPADDWIASKNICMDYALIIYQFTYCEDAVWAGSCRWSAGRDVVEYNKPRLYRLRYDNKHESLYFIKDHRRQYIDEFMRRNYGGGSAR